MRCISIVNFPFEVIPSKYPAISAEVPSSLGETFNVRRIASFPCKLTLIGVSERPKLLRASYPDST